MSDDQLWALFERGELPPEGFHHAEHVRVAFRHLSPFDPGLRRLAAAAGRPGVYHATITWAYLAIIGERLARSGPCDWPTFAAANRDLLEDGQALLARYYSNELLGSERARATFVPPDCALAR